MLTHQTSMIKNYLITAIRNIYKHKGYAILNIAGLAVGLAVFSLTAVFRSAHCFPHTDFPGSLHILGCRQVHEIKANGQQ